MTLLEGEARSQGDPSRAAVPRIPCSSLALLGQGYSWSTQGALCSAGVSGPCAATQTQIQHFLSQTVSCCPHISAVSALTGFSWEAFHGRIAPCTVLLQGQQKPRVRQVLLARIWISALRQQSPLSTQTCSITAASLAPGECSWQREV